MTGLSRRDRAALVWPPRGEVMHFAARRHERRRAEHREAPAELHVFAVRHGSGAARDSFAALRSALSPSPVEGAEAESGGVVEGMKREGADDV